MKPEYVATEFLGRDASNCRSSFAGVSSPGMPSPTTCAAMNPSDALVEQLLPSKLKPPGLLFFDFQYCANCAVFLAPTSKIKTVDTTPVALACFASM